VGSNREVLARRGKSTRIIDLLGRCVLPGLIDSHTHPDDASMTEFDHVIPDMEAIHDVLDYVKARALIVKPGNWITVRQVFITRLREQRYPTREELDGAAPEHPVVFSTGPDASLNSLALKLSGIDRNFKVTDGGPGYAEKDTQSGEPTGILRSCTRYVKSRPSGKASSDQDRYRRLVELFHDYNSVGITSIADRNANPSGIGRYQSLLRNGDLSVRIAISHGVAAQGNLDAVLEKIRAVAAHPLRRDDPMLRIVGIKTFLDGGMLTGSAYMRQPWGNAYCRS
jgi:hypothetical protein